MVLHLRGTFLFKNEKLKLFTSLWLIFNNYEKFGIRSIMNMVHDKAFINNEWVTGKNGKTFNVINPATEKVLGAVPDLEVDDVKPAIEAAHKAFPEWSSMPAIERGKILLKMKSLLEENINDIGKIVTSETGKPIAESLTEINYSGSFLQWFSEQSKRLDGEIYVSQIKSRLQLSIKQPIGVVALLTPWNFPLSMILRKTSAALAIGCTCIIKPSEVTPLTALAFADIAQKSKLPKGVINVITSDHQHAASVGKLLCDSPLIAGLSFTGSTEVGKILYGQCSRTVKRISLELGGNNPFVVFDSANVEDAVAGGIAARFRNTGQTCVSANRFLLHESVYEKFIGLMETKMKSLKVGDGLESGVNIGPLTTVRQVEKIESLVKNALSKGAKLIMGGKRTEGKGKHFYDPTLLRDVKPDMLCFREEIFGPVVSCTKFKTEDEVIKMSNDTRMGLCSYFYSSDLSQIVRVAKKMEVGMVGVNIGAISSIEAPFGGVKESGIGRESSHHGIDEFADIKYICVGNLR